MPHPGSIVLADWRDGALPKEPNKLRPAVVIDGDRLFAPGYPYVLLVPLSADEAMLIAALAVQLLPTAENGCTKACWAMSYLVTSTAKARIRATESRVTREQLAEIRRQVALAIGIEI